MASQLVQRKESWLAIVTTELTHDDFTFEGTQNEHRMEYITNMQRLPISPNYCHSTCIQ